MMSENGLATDLAAFAGDDPLRRATAAAVMGLAEAGIAIARLVAAGPHAAGHADVVGENIGGDSQKMLDVRAHEIIREALTGTGVAWLGSEEADAADLLDPDGLVVVAVDPLDGSSNIDCNISIGTVFSILPVLRDGDSFLQPGRRQLAAGMIVYGPHTDLVVSFGSGVEAFTLNRDDHEFRRVRRHVTIPEEAAEFAINASNYRHWDEGVRRWFDDCIAGKDGPRGRNFNMRWVASLVAETTRIFARGGVFLYPADGRRDYSEGRLRLVYECNPIAFLVEQAGGRASNGRSDILDLVPIDLHQRTPFMFGAAGEVTLLEETIANPDSADRSPLFAYRGLYRQR